VLGTSAGALQHAINVVTDAGWLEKIADPLRKNRYVYELTEPMVRFQRIVVERNEARLLRGQAKGVWTDVRPEVASKIYGPHAEHLAREWVLSYADHATIGGIVHDVGPSEVAGVGQVDLVGVEATASGGRRPVFIGEVKATASRTGVQVLERLDAAAAKIDPGVMRLLVSISGFTSDLERAAAKRKDVQLVDVHRLYHGA
jgi:Restriction endonuclease